MGKDKLRSGESIKKKDVKVNREFIDGADEWTQWAIDGESDTFKMVHIKDAFNGLSHEYYIPDKYDSSKLVRVRACQGEKSAWYFGTYWDKIKNTDGVYESLKHYVAKRMIKELGCLKVEALTFADDTAINSDFSGFRGEDGKCNSVFKNQVLINAGTLVAEKAETEVDLGGYRSDVLYTVGNEKYAIEVVYTHGLWPDEKTGHDFEKMKYYYDKDINVIVVEIGDLSIEDIVNGKFTGKWRLSNYARKCLKTLWHICDHSFVKDSNNHNAKYNIPKDGYVACVRKGNVSVAACEECRKKSWEKGEPFVFMDAERNDVNMDKYFYEEMKSLCVHCLEEGAKQFRRADSLNVGAVLNNFNIRLGFSLGYFDKKLTEYKEKC